MFSRRAPDKTPANETRFLSDDDLEGRRLERVLGWSLMFVTLFAVVMLVYMVREPTRQDHSIAYFKNGSVDRGRTLFANPSSEFYNSVLSLQCANCHGSEGGGGSTTAVIDPDGPEGPQPPESFIWKAPALNTELLRFSPEEVEQIITYGRPGTPMQAFGVLGGGAENTQTIEDLVAYIQSIQLSPEKAQEQAAADLEAAQRATAGAAGRRGSRAERRSERGPAHHRRDGRARYGEGHAHHRARRARVDEHRRAARDVQGPRDRSSTSRARRPTRRRPRRPRRVATS